MSLYDVIRFLFKTASHIFYASFDVRGLDNVPVSGEPTLLCFNHGNSLGDPVVVMSTTPITVSFCAKDTLWKVPFFKYFIKYSGAIPVYRKREHGENASKFNEETFKAVYKALEQGKCVAFAPEGVSKFVSYATKFKSGVAHIAVESVVRNSERDANFKVKLLPVCMAWTHREKFRSDVLVRFCEVIEVDKNFVDRFKSKKEAAECLIQMLEDKFYENMISAPNWKIIKCAITATRIHRPFGTSMSLSSYMTLLRGWIDILMQSSPETLKPMLEDNDSIHNSRKQIKSKSEADNQDAVKKEEKMKNVEELIKSLDEYQRLIDGLKVKDERFRRIEFEGGRPSWMKTIRVVLYRSLIAALLWGFCTPGLLLWSPVWSLIKMKERGLLKKGQGWVDSVAEHKMMYGFIFILLAVIVANVFAPALLLYLWLTLRSYEEAIACSRSIFGLIRLRLLSDVQLETVLKQRTLTEVLVKKFLPDFPATLASRIKFESGDDVYKVDKKQDHDKSLPKGNWYHNFHPFRRWKKDWNEMLRLSDYCTMDYVE